MEKAIKRLFSETAIYGLSTIIGRALNFLLVPLYVYVFSDPKDYGVVSILYSWVAFLIVLLPLGMETAFYKFSHDDKHSPAAVYQNGLLTIILFNVGFWLVGSVTSPQIADWMLLKGHSEYIILLLSIVCIDAIAALPLARLKNENKAKNFALIQLTSIAVNIISNVVLLLFFFDKSTPEQGVMYILISNLLASLVKPLLLYKDYLKLRFTFDSELAKQMLLYSIPLIFAGFAGIINETIDRILLQNILYDVKLEEWGNPQQAIAYAEGQVGIYSACYKLAMLVTIILQAYRYAAEPFFFNNSKNTDSKKMYIKVMNYIVAALCVVFLGVALNLQLFKYFIPNPAYWEGLKVVPLLLLANVFLGIYINQSIWYKLTGLTKYGAYIAIGGAFLTISINYLFIPMYGYMASAWATMLVYAAMMVASYIWGQQHYPINYNVRKFVLYFGSALVVFFALHYLALADGWLQFFVHNFAIALFVGGIVVMERGTKG